MSGHGVSSRSSHSAAAGRTTVAANSCTQSLTWITSSDSSRENATATRPFRTRSANASPQLGEQLYTGTYRSVRSARCAVPHSAGQMARRDAGKSTSGDLLKAGAQPRSVGTHLRDESQTCAIEVSRHLIAGRLHVACLDRLENARVFVGDALGL